MAKTNFIDKFIGFLNPRAGLERVRARAALEQVARHYEGATKGRRTDGWKTYSSSARTSTESAINRLRDRSRDLTRNNPYAAKALAVIETNTVGTGIVPRALLSSTRGSPKRAENIMKLWRDWAETTACDADGRHDIYGLQALVMRTVAESGECLIRRRWRRGSDGLAVPLQLQVLEPDFIDTTKDTIGKIDNGTEIVQGIQFDALGRRIGYMLYNQHPGDNQSLRRLESDIVPASEIIHVYRVDRPGQVRGVPWAAPVMIRLRDFDDYEDAQLLRQKLAACFTAFVTDTDAGTIRDGKNASLASSLEPGAIEILPPGKSIEFAAPPGVDGYSDYTQVMLRSIAAGFGVTYESLTGDLGNVNFSSGRMGWLEFHRNIEAWRWKMLIPTMCNGTWSWFMEAAALVGTRTEGVTVQWTPPRREMIDPVAETNAAKSAIRAGLLTLPEALRERGIDPEIAFQEMAETNKRLDDLKLVLDSDPRKVSNAGLTQARPDGTVIPSTDINDNNGGGTA